MHSLGQNIGITKSLLYVLCIAVHGTFWFKFNNDIFAFLTWIVAWTLESKIFLFRFTSASDASSLAVLTKLLELELVMEWYLDFCFLDCYLHEILYMIIANRLAWFFSRTSEGWVFQPFHQLVPMQQSFTILLKQIHVPNLMLTAFIFLIQGDRFLWCLILVLQILICSSIHAISGKTKFSSTDWHLLTLHIL